jgi:hypothetical protein
MTVHSHTKSVVSHITCDLTGFRASHGVEAKTLMNGQETVSRY